MLLADNMHLKTYMIIPASSLYTVKTIYTIWWRNDGMETHNITAEQAYHSKNCQVIS